MTQKSPRQMQAAAIDRFGGIETVRVRQVPVPNVGDDEILIRVETAGVGVWDPFEREGGFAKEYGFNPPFPYVLGSDGAGTIEAVGKDVNTFKIGDPVYGISLMNPKGGFQAQYAVIKAALAAPVPGKLTTQQAGAMAVDAITALSGLDDTLGLRSGESVLIFGASGGIGHLAVQLAKRMGARVVAAASGEDGVALVKQLGADVVVDGYREDVAAAARRFSPPGVDAALLTAGGAGAEKALSAVRDGGRVAYPNGVVAPQGRPGLKIQNYNGAPSPQSYAKLERLIKAGPFSVHIAKTFPLQQAVDAQKALADHYLGKLALVTS